MNNLFFKTRLRLTLLYIGIIVILLFLFSQIIYISVSGNIKNNTEGDFLSKQQQRTFIQKQVDSLQITLISANTIILIIVGSLSYFLAGITLKPVEKSLEQQKQFLSDASHELRTPLAILQTNFDNARKEKKRDSKEYKEIISNLEEVERMTNLVNELLLLSRLDTTTETLEFNRLALSPLIQSSIERFHGYAEKRSVTIRIHFPKITLVILANKILLSRAIDNLIKNAIDYNYPHGSVAILLEKQKTKAVLNVTDTGMGIPSEHLSRIFDRFYKGEESRSEHKGTGLGLAITKSIIAKHKGTIAIKDTSEKGTTVQILLPLAS